MGHGPANRRVDSGNSLSLVLRNIRPLWFLIAGALCLTACPSIAEESGPSTSASAGPDDPSGPNPTLPGAPTGSETLAGLPGRLAITSGTELVLSDPSGGGIEVIDSADFVAQPTWSPSGSALAWTRVAGGEAVVALRAIETTDTTDTTDLPAVEMVETIPVGSQPAIYLQWNASSDHLGFLQATPDGVTLSTAPVATGAQTRLGVGESLFFSWAPEGTELATHTGPSLSVLAAGSSSGVAGVPRLLESDRWFSAPVWLDSSSLLAARPSDLVRVDAVLGDSAPELALTGPTEFVVNRPRTHVAFVQLGVSFVTVQSPGPEPEGRGGLQVLDLRDGTLALVGLSDGQAVTPFAFEWSPDGSVLALMAPSELQPGLVRWYFWQLGPGGGHLVGATTAFRPSEVSLTSYLPFFAQYAQSATGWSPDGSAFAFTGAIDTVGGVFVHVLGQTPQSVYVGPGDYVAWSPANVQSGGRSIL